jgi:hypothetical protein
MSILNKKTLLKRIDRYDESMDLNEILNVHIEEMDEYGAVVHHFKNGEIKTITHLSGNYPQFNMIVEHYTNGEMTSKDILFTRRDQDGKFLIV